MNNLGPSDEPSPRESYQYEEIVRSYDGAIEWLEMRGIDVNSPDSAHALEEALARYGVEENIEAFFRDLSSNGPEAIAEYFRGDSLDNLIVSHALVQYLSQDPENNRQALQCATESPEELISISAHLALTRDDPDTFIKFINDYLGRPTHNLHVLREILKMIDSELDEYLTEFLVPLKQLGEHSDPEVAEIAKELFNAGDMKIAIQEAVDKNPELFASKITPSESGVGRLWQALKDRFKGN